MNCSRPLPPRRPRSATRWESAIRRRSWRCSTAPSTRWRISARDDGAGSARQLAYAHQRRIFGARALAAFANRPDDQRLSAAHVAAGENLVLGSGVAQRIGVDVSAVGETYAGLVEHSGLLRAEETHRQEDQIGGEHELAARY